MPSVRIAKSLSDQPHFLTLTVKNWYYIFDRHHRFEILEDSFVYCQKHKNLKINAFVFMLNHLHFIASAPNLAAVVRDMKTFLSKELQRNIIATDPSVLKIFKEGHDCHFWQDKNFPELITSEKFLHQKIEYIHNNPVRKGYVYYPEDWRWSSASKIPSKITVSNI